MNGLLNSNYCNAGGAGGAITPGAGKIEYCPVDELIPGQYHRALSAAYNQQRDAGAGTWYNLPHLPDTGNWREGDSPTQQGPTFPVTITAKVPNDTAPQFGTLDDMARHAFIVRISKGGRVVLCGTPEQPLTFSSQFDSGTAGSDTRAHTITFTGVQIKKTPGYIPVF